VDIDHRPHLLFIGTDQAVREDLCFVDADTTRCPDVESARRWLLRDPDARRGVAVIAYGPDIAAGFDPNVTVPLHTRAWVAPIVLVHGAPSAQVQAGAKLLEAKLLSLPRDWAALLPLLNNPVEAGKGEAS
jgi:hypothetical protein